MATATIKRHDTEPAPQLTINTSSGTYDLSNHNARFLMVSKTTLSTAITNVETTLVLPAAIADIVEENDLLLVDHERMQVVLPLPVQPVAGVTVDVEVTRAFTIPATAGEIIGSLDVSTFVLSDNAVFTLKVDAPASALVTVTAASTAANANMADLVIDVQAACDAALGAVCTVSSQNAKIVITSNTTGAASAVVLSSPDLEATDELGLIASNGSGAAAQATAGIAHAAAAQVRIIKIERTAIIQSPATGGVLTVEWADGDTDRVGEFLMEFEVKSSTGRQFTVPNDESFSVSIVEDMNDITLA